MAGPVRVQNLEMIQRFRMDLNIFVERCRTALDDARNDANRTLWWLQYDRLPHWQREVRRREARVNQARQDLMSAKMFDRSESNVSERRALRKAEEALEEARQKVDAVKLWLRRFDHDARTLTAQWQRLSVDLDHDLPRAVDLLSRLIDSIEGYLDDSAPGGAQPPPPPAPEEDTHP